MRILIAVSLFLASTLSHGENNSSTLRYLTLKKEDIISIEEIGEKTRQSFDGNGGKFEVLVPARNFIFKAPNCQKNIILRVWFVPKSSKDRQEQLDKHWELLQKIYAVALDKEKSITIPVSAKPYMKINKNGEPILEYCNAFIPRDFWKYSLDKNESNTLGKPVEPQNAPLELENK